MDRPGGGIYFASNFEGHVQSYELERPGGEPRRITETGERIVPHANTGLGLLLRTDNGGDEHWQLVIREAGGELRALTHDRRAIHQSVTLHPDGRRVALGWNPAGQQDVVIGELDLASGELTEWATPGYYWSVFDWSPDGSRMAVTKALGSLNEAYLLDRDGTLTRVLPGARRVELFWTRTGLYALSDLESDFFGSLCEVDPANPGVPGRWIHRIDRDIEAVVPDPAGARAALLVNNGIYDQFQLLDLAGGGATVSTDLGDGIVVGDHSGPAGYHVNWSGDGSRLFLAWERTTQPADVVAWPGGQRWTGVNPDPGAGLVQPVETAYTTFDGLTVPALFYRVDERPRPAVVYFHGGPEGQSRGEYRPIYHLMTRAGINVFVPNVRGSTGYGLRYQQLDDKTLRWDSVRDGCRAGRHLLDDGMATKVAAMGGSYGGFMTLAVIVEDPELWSAAVDLVGIANWHSFFANMGAWRRVLRMQEYGDPNGAEAEFLREISPLHHADKITAPLLILHGRNDPRVPVQETEQMAKAAKDVELMIFEDEGHGITRHANMIRSNTRILDFLTEKLLEI